MPTPNIQSYWFTYDADNRVDIVNGQLSGSHIALTASAAPYELTYDAAGNTRIRTAINATGTTMAQSSYYDERNELVQANYSVALGSAADARGVEETRSYDAAGRLSVTAQFYAAGTIAGGSNMPYWKRDPDLDMEGYYDGTDVSRSLPPRVVLTPKEIPPKSRDSPQGEFDAQESTARSDRRHAADGRSGIGDVAAARQERN